MSALGLEAGGIRMSGMGAKPKVRFLIGCRGPDVAYSGSKPHFRPAAITVWASQLVGCYDG
jgi:hypothetical protein